MGSRILRLGIACGVVCCALSVALAQTVGVKKKRARPYEYGNVVMDAMAKKAAVAPVVFEHWLHRSRYTCRLCHIDIGFAMQANDTMISCDDIEAGFYCGSCHNGEEAFARSGNGRGGDKSANCVRCHAEGDETRRRDAFYELAHTLPRERFGNGIDWEKAEEDGLIRLKDFLPGISIRKQKLKDPEDLEIRVKESGMPDIIFSHDKHAAWSGCELCHPDIFGVKTGQTVYTMQEIFDGRFCGACHGSVAFPNIDCQRCHTKEVI